MGQKHSKLFNIIAPIYAKFFGFQVRYYNETILKVKDEIDVTQYKTVLDIGCGTGALSYVLYKKDLKVTGIDIVEKMVEKSKEKLQDTEVEIYHTTIIEWLERGDYFNFIKVAEKEMKEHFKTVKVVDVYKRAAWHILEP